MVIPLLALPFVSYIARFVEWLGKDKGKETPEKYQLVMPKETAIKENIEAYILQAEREISMMSTVVRNMFDTLRPLLEDAYKGSVDPVIAQLVKQEDYADQMQEELSVYLIKTSQLSLSEKNRKNVRLMLGIVDDIENKLIVTAEDKKYSIDQIKALVEFQERFFKTEIIMEK